MSLQGSSIGKYNAQWVRGFQVSAEGGNSVKEWLGSATLRKKAEYPASAHLKIMFPTQTTVEDVGREVCIFLLFF